MRKQAKAEQRGDRMLYPPSRIFLTLLSLISPTFALAQTSLDDITSQLESQKSELDEVDALLADPDKNRRIAAMELLLKSGNPVFVSRAKEVGLFSSDPEMQAAALKAIFDAGGPFRLVVDYSGVADKDSGIKEWLSRRGNWDDTAKTGVFLFTTQPYDPEKKCWRFPDDWSCAIALSGLTVSLPDWSRAEGIFELSSDGTLSGNFRTTSGNGVSLPAKIELTE